jgi:spore coat protein U-like protein
MKTKFNQSKLKLAIVSAMALGSATLGIHSYALTTTDNLIISAEIAVSCTVVTTDIAFGDYSPLITHATATLDGTATITSTCTSGASTVLTLDQGQVPLSGSTEGAPLRSMTGGLAYNLYTDSAHTTVWGNTTGTGVAVTGTGAGVSTTVYGSVAAGQTTPTSGGADSVVLLLTY